jgi:TolB protein
VEIMNSARTATTLVAALAVLGCGDSGTTTAPIASQVQAVSSQASLTVLTGRIVYSSKGLRVKNLATGTDIKLTTSGVNPEFSPDGTLIVFQVGSSGIRVMNADGTNVRTLSGCGGSPTFNPSGTKVAFKDNGCATSGIWTVNLDGTGLTQLMSSDAHSPAWSPDGTQIAYGGVVGSKVQLFVMNADGTNQQQVLTSGTILDITWRPSPKVLFAVSNGNYDLYSLDPTVPASLTRLTTATGSDFEPSWSPDATQIAWVAGTSGPGSGIWTMNADGSGKQGPIIAKGRQGNWGQ